MINDLIIMGIFTCFVFVSGLFSGAVLTYRRTVGQSPLSGLKDIAKDLKKLAIKETGQEGQKRERAKL